MPTPTTPQHNQYKTRRTDSFIRDNPPHPDIKALARTFERELDEAMERVKEFETLHKLAAHSRDKYLSELTAAKELIEKLVEAVNEGLCYMTCTCGHPHCKRCKATKYMEETLAREKGFLK